MQLSIIIPCRNLESYIERCLRSILQQTLSKSEYEIILIFDVCSDQTENVAKDFLTRSDCHFLLLHSYVGNSGYARNVGLDEARGKYVNFIDGDDYLIDNDALFKLIQNAETKDCNVVCMSEFESDTPVEEDMAVWRYLFRRDFIGNARFKILPVNEDWDFVFRMINKSDCRITTVPYKFYHYTFPREGSITSRFRKNNKA